jgi:hypothetical protein
MRGYIILTVVIVGALWTIDVYRMDGRYSKVVWKQTSVEIQTLRRAIDRAMSGKCYF